MRTLMFGYDYGNTEACSVLVAPGMHAELCIPSVSACGSWKRVVDAARGVGKEPADLLPADHYILEYCHNDQLGASHQVERFIGQKVFDEGLTPLSTRGDAARYWKDAYSREMLMVSAGSLVPDTEYELDVVTGLPISIYLDHEDHARNVEQVLQGTYHYRLNGVQRTMHVRRVKCIMKGAGALIAYGANSEVLQGVIDIGGQTTDLFLAQGQKPRPAHCKSIPKGVAAAAERLVERFREAYGYTLSLEARQMLLRQHVNQEPYRIVRDREHQTIPSRQIAILIETALREVGQEIAAQVAASWNDLLMDLDRVLVVGGGAYYYLSDIQARIRLARRSEHRPEMANAIGYAMLAERLAQRLQMSKAGRSV